MDELDPKIMHHFFVIAKIIRIMGNLAFGWNVNVSTGEVSVTYPVYPNRPIG